MECERVLLWLDEKLYTCGTENSISFEFTGRVVAIILNYGKSSGMIEYRTDNGEWHEYFFEKYWWVPEENFVNVVKFADDFELGKHKFELRASYVNKPDFTSCSCSILKVLTVR